MKKSEGKIIPRVFFSPIRETIMLSNNVMKNNDKLRTQFIKENNIRLIPGAKNYGVNVMGEVFNVKTMRKLKATSNGWAGYKKVGIKYDCSDYRVCKTVHRLVWTTVNGEIPVGMEINHKDGDKANNALHNLELTTH